MSVLRAVKVQRFTVHVLLQKEAESIGTGTAK
jgi:hypothetical protein